MQEPGPLEFFGGSVGALAPFGIFIAGVTWLGLSENRQHTTNAAAA